MLKQILYNKGIKDLDVAIEMQNAEGLGKAIEDAKKMDVAHQDVERAEKTKQLIEALHRPRAEDEGSDDDEDIL